MRKLLAVLTCILMLFAGPLIVAPEAETECIRPLNLKTYQFEDGVYISLLDIDCDCKVDIGFSDTFGEQAIIFNMMGFEMFMDMLKENGVKYEVVPGTDADMCQGQPDTEKNEWRPNNRDTWSCYNR